MPRRRRAVDGRSAGPLERPPALRIFDNWTQVLGRQRSAANWLRFAKTTFCDRLLPRDASIRGCCCVTKGKKGKKGSVEEAPLSPRSPGPHGPGWNGTPRRGSMRCIQRSRKEGETGKKSFFCRCPSGRNGLSSFPQVTPASHVAGALTSAERLSRAACRALTTITRTPGR